MKTFILLGFSLLGIFCLLFEPFIVHPKSEPEPQVELALESEPQVESELEQDSSPEQDDDDEYDYVYDTSGDFIFRNMIEDSEDQDAVCKDYEKFGRPHSSRYYINKAYRDNEDTTVFVETRYDKYPKNDKYIRVRDYVPLKNKALQQKIAKETKGMSEKEIIAYSEELTKSLLTLSSYSELKSLDRLSVDKKIPANSEGYARTYAAICNYAFDVNDMPKAMCYHIVSDIRVLFFFNLTKIAHFFFETIGDERRANLCKDLEYNRIVFSDGTTQDVDILS